MEIFRAGRAVPSRADPMGGGLPEELSQGFILVRFRFELEIDGKILNDRWSDWVNGEFFWSYSFMFWLLALHILKSIV